MINSEKLNQIIFDGLLPVAFANSNIIKVEINNITRNKSHKSLNKIYKQIELPEASSQILISKIYDICTFATK